MYELSDIAKDIISSSEFVLDYDLSDDIEKMILSNISFKLNYQTAEVLDVIKKMLRQYFDKYIDKNFIIFYDSAILDYDFKFHENCYCFDVNGMKDLKDYNIFCDEELKEFNLSMILDKLESMWPVEFDEIEIKSFVKEYYCQTRYSKEIYCMCENQLITYTILKKINNEDIIINMTKFIIRDNVKQFLEHI